ncbi:MAG: V-type ATP synthase subunit D [Spirochaetales bacterium]|nr:V-type ATP synthase subunit D [Spirochaetales bacterium]
MKFQFNKTALQKLKRELLVRQKALPTLKAKETALRLEVRKSAELLQRANQELEQLMRDRAPQARLWLEFPAVLAIRQIELRTRNVAGVRVQELETIHFDIRNYSLYANRAWVPGGTDLLKDYCSRQIQIRLLDLSTRLLERARKKTTQKVNLYEKVQIPEYQSAILKIKRFLEDKENLSIAASKIVKEKQKQAS